MLPWIGKYRPTTLDNIKGQDHVITLLEHKTNITHLCFHGAAGVGKTTCAKVVANMFYGDKVKDFVLELNASDERGIGVVRDKIIPFSKRMCRTNKNIGKRNQPPSFNLVILDEADAMTIDAQSALRKVMEDYAHITRFIIICNFIGSIIDPVISRCNVLKFNPISDTLMMDTVKNISIKEKCHVNNDILKSICNHANHDLRKAINTLQVLTYCGNKKITQKLIDNICGSLTAMHTKKITKFFDTHNHSIDYCIKLTKMLTRQGYNVQYILNCMVNIFMTMSETDEMSIDMIRLCGNTCRNMQEGGDSYIQLLNIFVSWIS